MNAVCVYFFPKRFSAYPQHFGGLCLIAHRCLQYFHDMISLRVGSHVGEPETFAALLSIHNKVRYIILADRSGRGKGDAAFNDVSQFPDIAGIIIGKKQFYRFARETDIFRKTTSVLVHKKLYERQDVLASFPERWHAYGYYIEPVKEVFPEPSGLHLFFKRSVGCCNDADINGQCRGAADPLELSFLNNPENPCLRGKRQIGNLVKENGAAVGGLKSAGLPSDGAGKGPFFMAKQLAF